MTEVKNKTLVRKELEKDGWLVWYPPVSRFAPKFPYCTETNSAKDIFTIFDCLALKDSCVRFIQYTSHGHRLERKRKIEKFYEDNDVFLPAEIWGIRDDKSYEIICI